MCDAPKISRRNVVGQGNIFTEGEDVGVESAWPVSAAQF